MALSLWRESEERAEQRKVSGQRGVSFSSSLHCAEILFLETLNKNTTAS